MSDPRLVRLGSNAPSVGARGLGVDDANPTRTDSAPPGMNTEASAGATTSAMITTSRLITAAHTALSTANTSRERSVGRGRAAGLPHCVHDRDGRSASD